MKAQFVSENMIDFQRGEDPKRSLRIGKGRWEEIADEAKEIMINDGAAYEKSARYLADAIGRPEKYDDIVRDYNVGDLSFLEIIKKYA